MQNYLITFGLPDSSIHLLVNLLNSEFEITKCISHFQMITKKKQSEASQLARQALQDLKLICQNAVAYGVSFEMVVSPGLVYNIQQYSGVIFQFVCEMKKKNRHNSMEVVAAGGRYDGMIAYYRILVEQANMLNKGVQQSAVGISFSLDKLVQAIQKEQSDDLPKMDPVDVVVCSVGFKQMVKEKTKILRSLWLAGIKCFLIESTNIEEIQEQLIELKVSHVIILKENEHGTVRVRSWERDRFQEKSFSTTELIENMHKILKNWNDVVQENSNTALLRSESKVSSTERNDQEANVYVDYLFVTAEKLSSNARKRYENQIRSQLDGLFKKFTGYVVVVGLSLDSTIVKWLASFLDFESEYNFQKSVEGVIERHPRHKKYLNDICDEIYKQKTSRTDPTLVLYSIFDYSYKVVL
nr:unnamed protein product [Callosobruchus chinensis]